MLILKLFRKCLAQLPSTLMRFGLLLGFALATMPIVGAVENQIDIEAFVRNGCPHCQQAEHFLAALQGEQPGLRIVIRNISAEPTALGRLQQITESRQAGPIRLPTFLVRGEYIVGYSAEADSSGLIRNALRAGAPPSEVSDAEAGSCEVQVSESCDVPVSQTAPTEPAVFAVNWFGRRIGLDEVGLPAFTLAMGLLDGFNPCSMWVLILMISMLAPTNNRPRMLAVAGTFVVVEGMAYFVFMAAWLNLFLLIGLSRASELAIAGIAVLAGAINLKDFWAFGRGISLSIPAAAKPGIYNRIRRILQAENLAGAMLGAVVLALLVQIVELLCTSGFPALYTRILTLRELSGWDYYGYLMLYNLAYMLDDVVLLGVGVVTLSQRRLQEKEGRWLKLLSGLAMVSLGLYLILRGLGE
ncbi:NrdH-redoxin [Methylomonas sp. EFPC1]|uniref:glutaredoxin family protein n=1 Tax=Methylomonas sp. EFPC1 TaxID=2812647 RepID=UPI001967C582|nr:NrdH-redoxin [Methylomonas sp. EFPC1]QSB02587.1 NrdH-redoxin [Methylomonas sp. EFPC1]